MPRQRLAIILIGFLLPLCSEAQALGPGHGETVSATRQRIAELKLELKRQNTPGSNENKYMVACASTMGCDFSKNPQLREIYSASLIERANRLAAVNRVVSQIHHQVDAFIASTVNPMTVSKPGIEKDLKDILDIRAQDEDTPSAFISDTAKERFLVIAYEIDKGFMGTGGTSVTLRAYRASPGQFKLADSTGDSLDGYAAISLKELRSPAESLPKGAGDIWLLAWGYMTGANGPNVRMRLFAFDGDKFRTVWMPENSWGNFEVVITSNGFAVDGDYYKENRKRHDTYVLAEDGLYRGK